METVAPPQKQRKPDTFSTGKTHVQIALQPENMGHGNHSKVMLVVNYQISLLTPSTARAVAKSLTVWASMAEARRARHGQDMPSTGQGEAPRE